MTTPIPLTHDRVRAIVREELDKAGDSVPREVGLPSWTLGPCNAVQTRRFARTLRRLLDVLDGEIVVAALIREGEADLLNSGRQEVDRVREFLDGRIVMRSEPSDFRESALTVLDAFANQFEPAADHNSSPSAGGCGDHSVGDGPVAGADSADPATEATMTAPPAPYRLLIVADNDDVRAITHEQVLALGCQAVCALGSFNETSPNALRGLYDGAVIDIRLAGLERMQWVLDQMFPPGQRYRAKFVQLPNLAPVQAPGWRSSVTLDGSRAIIQIETLPGEPLVPAICTVPALRRLHQVLGRAVEHLDRADADLKAYIKAGI